MKIAIPMEQGGLCPHFGHCQAFAIYTVEDGKIVKEETVDPPAHEPGSHPAFLHKLGCNVVIAGGMGVKAQELMNCLLYTSPSPRDRTRSSMPSSA